MKRILPLIIIALIVALALNYSAAQPSGANITSNITETKTPAAAEFLNTSGGTFTTVLLSAITQNLKWKAYAGNVTGVLTLDDSGNYSIYQWTISEFTGEVYASRNSSVSWPNIQCANLTHVANEEKIMNHTTSNLDSINNTFSSQLHKGFYVGNVQIIQSDCKSTFTWANDTAQTPSIDAPFQELLLYDGIGLVYATFIDDNTQGFNYKDYDFQMILADRGVGGYSATKYYFYMELQ